MPLQDADGMRAIAARYLLTAKNKRGQPYDPVARFHLGNGAIVHAVHADADTSPKGRAQSGGAMVNYLYDLGKTAQNHERFAETQEVIAAAGVQTLAAAASAQAQERHSNG